MSNGATHLEEAVTAAGIASVNFFNGRLLTGEDLSREQLANREGRLRLGQAIGAGIAYGFEVSESKGVSSPTRPVLRVQPGLAVNAEGLALELGDRIDLLLVEEAGPGAPDPTDLFADCPNGATGGYVAGFGAYLLAVGPSETRQGRAPTSGLANVDASCNSNLLVEGVTFRLVRIPLDAGIASKPGLVRNRIAGRAFGIGAERRERFFSDPFGPEPADYGLVDELLVGCLTPSEVPLAVLVWTAADGIAFVDMWSVRRRLTAPAADDAWPLLVGDRARAEAEALFLEFQEHIEDLTTSVGNLQTLQASDRFEFLPPVGALPIIGTGSTRGFNADVFFGDQAPTHAEMTDSSIFRPLLHEGLLHEPIAVDGKERIQLYLLWENVQAVRAGKVGQLAVVFAKDTVPYRGIARFGDAYWKFSRFAETVL
jgi:hypothetical protein